MPITKGSSMTNKRADAYMKEDQDRCRSLVCDASGIIVAEMVYRCMICFCVSDTMKDARLHYQFKHIDETHGEKNGIDSESVRNNNYSEMNGSAPPLADMSQHVNKFEPDEQYCNEEEDNYERLSPVVTMSEGLEPMNGSTGGGKSGYVNCAVCGVTRYYSCVQRRYGQFTCVTCYRYFRTFLLKPKRYSCPNLGSCQLNVRTRCRACWLSACISVFTVDLRRQEVINAYRPVRKAAPKASNVHEVEPDPMPEPDADMTEDHNESCSPQTKEGSENGDGHDHEVSTIMVSFNSGNELPSILEKSEVSLSNGKNQKGSPTQIKLTPGKKVWSCGKCATCMAEDCGKCIYCLDRPKFGGPFIKKQRCIKRRCLMKIKNKQNGCLSMNG